MNKLELKKVLKPLIKECVKEMLFEENLLGNIISEVLRGTTQTPILEQKRSQPNKQNEQSRKVAEQMTERTKVLKELSETAYGGIDIFENVTPLTSGGKANTNVVQESSGKALTGLAADDPGLNIEGILNVAGGASKWARLAKGK